MTLRDATRSDATRSDATRSDANCRHCHAALRDVFVDLVSAPPSNAFLTEAAAGAPEAWYPLKVYVCRNCFLVQLPEHKKSDEIFTDGYAYFSSFSTSWLAHAARYVEAIVPRLGLGPASRVLEVASNDGYLLKNFVARGIPCLGVEPSVNTAEAARAIGVETLTDFFTRETGARIRAERGAQDLIIGNNVLAHVTDINDFVGGLAACLAPGGTVTMEFPHLLNLIAETQFDTIYHEHFSYLSLLATARIFAAEGLVIYDVEELPTHGGSLRIYARHAADPALPVTAAVGALVERERAAGLDSLDGYRGFAAATARIRNDFLGFLLGAAAAGKTVVGYGAAAKGNTLLNFCGVRGADLVRFVADASPHKQGKLLPGSRIPVVSEAMIRETRPDYVVIFPWNLREEIGRQLSYIGDWGGRFVWAVPALADVPAEQFRDGATAADAAR